MREIENFGATYLGRAETPTLESLRDIEVYIYVVSNHFCILTVRSSLGLCIDILHIYRRRFLLEPMKELHILTCSSHKSKKKGASIRENAPNLNL